MIVRADLEDQFPLDSFRRRRSCDWAVEAGPWRERPGAGRAGREGGGGGDMVSYECRQVLVR